MFQETSSFFRLPKEIRLNIYELIYKQRHGKEVKIGNADFNDKGLSRWPQQPSICRICRLTRAETLGMYYSSTVFVFNVQRPSGEEMVLTWLNRMAASSLNALNHMKFASVITGLGHSEPPKEYMVDISQSLFLMATRPCAPAYLYKFRSNMRLWSHLATGALKKRLRELPNKEASEFDAAQNLREIIAVVSELSGYPLNGDLASSVFNETTPIQAVNVESANQQSLLLALPKELRVLIYEHALSSYAPVTIGQRAVSLRDLIDWSTYPALAHTSALVRCESMPIYFGVTHFILNIQRTQCEDIVLDWINRSSKVYPEAFKHIQHVSVIAGSGIRQPPRQYEFYIQQNKLVSTIDRPILQPYTLPANRWSPPLWEQLRQQLLQMPKKGDHDFNAAENLRGIIAILARCSD